MKTSFPEEKLEKSTGLMQLDSRAHLTNLHPKLIRHTEGQICDIQDSKCAIFLPTITLLKLPRNRRVVKELKAASNLDHSADTYWSRTYIDISRAWEVGISGHDSPSWPHQFCLYFAVMFSLQLYKSHPFVPGRTLWELRTTCFFRKNSSQEFFFFFFSVGPKSCNYLFEHRYLP